MFSGKVIEKELPDGGWVSRETHYTTILDDLSERNNILFSIMAAHDAHIVLSEQLTENLNGNNFVELTLGGWENTMSMIRVKTTGGEDGRVNTPHLLNEDKFQDFWLAWNSTCVVVGRGFIIGQQIFMQKDIPEVINYNYMGIFSGYGSGSSWVIYKGTYIHRPARRVSP